MLFYNKLMVSARQIHDTIRDILEEVVKNIFFMLDILWAYAHNIVQRIIRYGQT